MKKILFTLLLSLCLTLPAWANSGLSISKQTIDFGAMTEGPVAQQTVTITNTTAAAITIDNVSTS